MLLLIHMTLVKFNTLCNSFIGVYWNKILLWLSSCQWFTWHLLVSKSCWLRFFLNGMLLLFWMRSLFWMSHLWLLEFTWFLKIFGWRLTSFITTSTSVFRLLQDRPDLIICLSFMLWEWTVYLGLRRILSVSFWFLSTRWLKLFASFICINTLEIVNGHLLSSIQGHLHYWFWWFASLSNRFRCSRS